MMLTPEQLAALRQTAERSTKGNWRFENVEHGNGLELITDASVKHSVMWVHSHCGEPRLAFHRGEDMDYVAAANPAVMLQLLAHIDAQQASIAELEKYAARYRWLRNPNQRIDRVIDKRVGELSSGIGIWEYKSGEELDAAIDAAMQPTLTDDTSDYGSRIAVIGQNGATGEHYEEERKQ